MPARLLGFSTAEKIGDFENALVRIREDINTGALIHTAVVALRTSDTIGNIGMSYWPL